MFKVTTPSPEVGPLQKHLNATYYTLRWGLGLIAIAFPVVLVAGGALYIGTSLQGSMSAYYHAEMDGRSMRDWFVGTLFALGALLYLYKGFSKPENVLLNVAGFFAVCVAIFPMEWPSGSGGAILSFHGASAIGVFVCLALVAWFTAADTLKLVDESRRQRYARRYKILAGLMVASPVIAYVISVILQRRGALVLVAEVLGIWFFAAYWLLKSREMRETQADVLGLQGSLELE